MDASWIHFDTFTIVSGFAIMIMAVALWKAFVYKSTLPDGSAIRNWRVLITLIGLLFAGFLFLPFFILFPQEWKDNIVSFLFLFGAVFVLIALDLVYNIVSALKKEP